MSNTGARTTTGALHFIYVHKAERVDESRSYCRARANSRGGGMQTSQLDARRRLLRGKAKREEVVPKRKTLKDEEATNRAFCIYTLHPSVVVVVIITLLLGRPGELLLPARVCLCSVYVREDEVEDFRVPGYGLAFDAFFDVLEM